MTTKYNFDDKFSVKNNLTGNVFINDITNQRIYVKNNYKKQMLAEFCITDLTWNDSNKDIDKIVLDGSARTEYTLASNHAALKNRLFKECLVSPGVSVDSPSKKFMHFSVNSLLYEFICVIVRKIQKDTLPKGLETVTLAITSSDTETLTNGTVIITATDEDSTAIQGLDITGTVGETEVTGKTNSSGQVSVTLEAAGKYDISVASAATSAYKAATKTGSVTATEIVTETEPGTD